MVRFCSHPVLRSYRCTLPRTRTATTHLLTTSPSCSLLFSTLAIINRYPQTKHQPMVFTRPTNQSSINRQSPSSINLLSLQGPRPPSPALPVSHAPVSATAIASLEWGERGPESRIHPKLHQPASPGTTYQEEENEEAVRRHDKKHLSQPCCCCCRRCWSAQGLLVSVSLTSPKPFSCLPSTLPLCWSEDANPYIRTRHPFAPG